jgi:hypothetical protein
MTDRASPIASVVRRGRLRPEEQTTARVVTGRVAGNRARLQPRPVIDAGYQRRAYAICRSQMSIQR